MKLHHIGVWASDPDAVRRFYEGTMGLQLEREYEVPAQLMNAIFGLNRDCNVMVFSGEEARVEVFEVKGESLSGINHFSISVGDRVEFFQRVKGAGGECLEVMRGDHPVYFVRGPEGLLIEIKD